MEKGTVSILFKPGFYNDPTTGFINLFGLMKAIKEERLGNQGALALLSVNEADLAQQRLEETLKELGLALASLTMELRSEGKGKGHSGPVAKDKLVLVYPHTTPQTARETYRAVEAAMANGQQWPDGGTRIQDGSYRLRPGGEKLNRLCACFYSVFYRLHSPRKIAGRRRRVAHRSGCPY